MNAARLLAEASALGAHFRLVDGRVKVAAPRPLPVDLMGELRARKDEIARTLSASSTPYTTAFDDLRRACPAGVAETRWRLAVADAGQFLDRWGTTAAAFEWPAPDLFDRTEHGADGLLWELGGRAVVALTAGGAMLGENATTSRAWYARPLERRTDAATA